MCSVRGGLLVGCLLLLLGCGVGDRDEELSGREAVQQRVGDAVEGGGEWVARPAASLVDGQPQLWGLDSDPVNEILFEAHEASVRGCMQERGWEYSARPSNGGHPWRSATVGRDLSPWVLDEADAERAGFRDPAMIAGSSEDGAARGDGAPERMSDPEQQAYDQALYGSVEDIVRVEMPDGAAVGITDDGCLFQARRGLFGELDRYVRLAYEVTNLDAVAVERARTSAAVAQRAGDWQACMAEAGFRGVGSVEEFVARAAEDNRRSEAVAHARCLTDSGLRDAFEEQRRRGMVSLLDERADEIAVFDAIQRRALARAETILAREPR